MQAIATWGAERLDSRQPVQPPTTVLVPGAGASVLPVLWLLTRAGQPPVQLGQLGFDFDQRRFVSRTFSFQSQTLRELELPGGMFIEVSHAQAVSSPGMFSLQTWTDEAGFVRKVAIRSLLGETQQTATLHFLHIFEP